jgi:hypothetical protein
MEDLIKRLSEVSEDSPAFDGLMLKFEMALNSKVSCGFPQEVEDEVEIDASWDEWMRD